MRSLPVFSGKYEIKPPELTFEQQQGKLERRHGRLESKSRGSRVSAAEAYDALRTHTRQRLTRPGSAARVR